MPVKALPLEIRPWRLAAKCEQIEGVIPLVRLEGLCRDLCDARGDVRVSLQMVQDGSNRGRLVGDVSANLTVVCQRCLLPMTIVLERQPIHLHIVKSAEEEKALSSDEEALVCGKDDSISLLGWMEQELLLCLPMVAKHPEGACTNGGVSVSQKVEKSKHPFDVLRKHK